MNATVKTLCDIDRIEIPPEMLSVCVDEREVDADVTRLGLRYATESEVESAVLGDTVCCRADVESYPDGRTILLYTAMELPGAEAAARAGLGKRLGECFETTLVGRKVTLTVEKILRRTPAKIDDALVTSMGLEGVSTLEEYRSYARAKRLADQHLEQRKEITRFLADAMVEESSFDYDAAELDKTIDEEIELYSADYAEESIDMTAEQMRTAIAAQIKQGWVARAFCESHGIEIDRAGVEEYTDQMLQMMSLMGEDAPGREEMLEMALQNEYFRGFYEYIDKLIERKMEA